MFQVRKGYSQLIDLSKGAVPLEVEVSKPNHYFWFGSGNEK